MMAVILDSIETDYIDAKTLLSFLKNYQNPRDWMSRKVHNGELMRLKNGFFLIASRFTKSFTDSPFEQIANLLYGPSYISLEWALSFYQFIPERVVMITSVTTGSNKEYLTPIGTFSYRRLNLSRYSVGMAWHKALLGGFLIASPEKALADWVFFTSKGLNEKELYDDLIHGKRINLEDLKSLDKNLLMVIAKQYQSKSVKNLYNIVNKL